jgi:uncharacterized damage-inducible protein DinB
MSISERLLPEFEHEMANTRKVLERVPENQLGWKPHEKSMTLGRLAGHVAEMPRWASHTLKLDVLDLSNGLEGEAQGHVTTSPQDTLTKFDNWLAEAKTALLATTDEAYPKTWKLVFQGQTFIEMPRSAVLRSFVMNHMIHHRGQLSVYLRLLGIPVPGFYGPSADEANPAFESVK